jgi:hypothetical protein
MDAPNAAAGAAVAIIGVFALTAEIHPAGVKVP